MKVGFSVVDITPEFGIYLTGYGCPERLAKELHSPLTATAMVLQDGEKSAAVIGFDWCVIDWELTQDIRHAVFEKTEIPEQNILLCCSHTHSAPHTTNMRTLGRSADDPENKGVEYVKKVELVYPIAHTLQKVYPYREATEHNRECKNIIRYLIF